MQLLNRNIVCLLSFGASSYCLGSTTAFRKITLIDSLTYYRSATPGKASGSAKDLTKNKLDGVGPVDNRPSTN